MYKKPNEIYAIVEQQRGLWGYRIELGTDEKGKRVTKTSFKKKYTKNTARIAGMTKVDELRLKLGGADFKRYLVEEYADVYFTYYKESNKDRVKPSTVALREFTLKKIKTDLAGYYINDISKKTLQEYIYKLLDSGLSENYVHIISVFLKMLFEFANKNGLRTSNIAEDLVIKRKKIYFEEVEEKDDNIIVLEPGELMRLYEVAEKVIDYRFYVAIRLLGNTGMRIGELLALKWSDVDVDNLEISINKTLYHKNDRTDGWVLLTPKTKYSIRKITILKEDMELLLKWKELQKIEWISRNKEVNSLYDNFIFTNIVYVGYPCSKRQFSYHFEKVIDVGNFNKKLTPHKLRHTHASILASAGVTLFNIKKRLGHGANSRTLERVYLHATKKSQLETLEKYTEYMESTNM